VSYRVNIRPQALTDISEAADWYEEHQPGLGERFIREVIAAIDALANDALVYRLRHKRFHARWCFPRHFPYRIVYRVVDDDVTVVAVVHAARHEKFWRRRF
jgi:plasmid stabilization system protein ParE